MTGEELYHRSNTRTNRGWSDLPESAQVEWNIRAQLNRIEAMLGKIATKVEAHGICLAGIEISNARIVHAVEKDDE